MAKPLKTRTFLKELRQDAKVRGLEVQLDLKRGHGSHYFVIIVEPRNKKVVKFTLADTQEVSPGVQRSILAWVQSFVKECAVHAAVHELLRRIFGF